MKTPSIRHPETEDLDTGVGLIPDKVKELGLSENTYIFYTSDNGAVPWVPPDFEKQFVFPMEVGREGRNYPLRQGKWSLFEGGLRVPLIGKGPGMKANSYLREVNAEIPESY